MKRTIFYSWQSDSPHATNREFIEDALGRALNSVRMDETARLDPVMDRDIAGVAGSPSISDSIFAKIARADLFVADITMVTSDAAGRLTPNPNVLVELGFAISALGWERIVLVQNTAFGKPDQLPFDLRGHHVIGYELATDTTDRAEPRGPLQGRLEEALRRGLKDSMLASSHAGPEVPVWWGHWTIESRGAAWGGHLFIREVGPAGFLFDIAVFSGTHTGTLSGFARLVSPDQAYARIQVRTGANVCELSFQRRLSDARRLIDIEEKASCFDHHGIGATFNGTFVREHDNLFDSGVIDEMDLQRLCSITGKHFADLSDCFQQVGDQEVLDQFQATAIVGAPRGMFTTMEGIVMRGKRGELWAAYTAGDEVHYFTTQREYRDRLPVTIEHWRERFKQRALIFDTDIDRIAPFM